MDYIFTGVFTFEMVIKVRYGDSCSFYEACNVCKQACVQSANVCMSILMAKSLTSHKGSQCHAVPWNAARELGTSVLGF